MADKKITSLSDLETGIASEDLLHVIDSPNQTPVNKKVSIANLLNYNPVPLATNTVETITADGAATLTKGVHLIDGTSGSPAVTLAAGTITGQIHTFIAINVDTAVTVTISDALGLGNIATFALGESISCIWTGAKWAWFAHSTNAAVDLGTAGPALT